jgi:MFS family permease
MSQASTLPVTFSRPPGTAHSVVAALLPIIAAVFVAYLVIGLAMPVLPLHVHEGLGLSTFVVGLVAGSQFAAALLSRPWAGTLQPRAGAGRKRSRPGRGVPRQHAGRNVLRGYGSAAPKGAVARYGKQESRL